MLKADDIKEKIIAYIPDADAVVEDLTGTGTNFAVDVLSVAFSGKNRLQQHQMIYKALGDEMREHIHALQIRTASKAGS